MNGQIDIYGVFLPALLVLAVIAYVLSRQASRVLARTGFYRLVWHRPLFDAALYVVILGLLAWITRGY
ncbi:DUF1656 domain-containing protein [Xinfangfangia sp. D13-10-4-6]|uniref:DUF1656 domain-containing protein n=1 Tax=Pseudogemmobacter hezensis TaxID=2737662 RepID=UPI001551E80F|nr:DUF1656 domain-containing protein [Pseudogemmobacter hezensis]NPD17722.1 DUF1656 domain-containing protein [Pseudogemmobacter hezensis]